MKREVSPMHTLQQLYADQDVQSMAVAIPVSSGRSDDGLHSKTATLRAGRRQSLACYIVSVILWKFVLQKAGLAQLLTAGQDQAQFVRLHPTP